MSAIRLGPELLPSDRELRALRLFVSPDATRPSMATLWLHLSEEGTTYVATDGHTIIIRRSGAHRPMSFRDIRKLSPVSVDERGDAASTLHTIPAWDHVLVKGKGGPLAATYSANPAYLARLVDVEKAAGQRAADDFRPSRTMSKKDITKERSALKTAAFVRFTIPSDPLDGWYWLLDTRAALWEGVIMPRRT